MATLHETIRASESLSAMADAGNDSGITSALNTIDDSIQLELSEIPPNYVVALATAAFQGAFQSGNAMLISFWSVIVTASTGFTDSVKAADPVLAQMMSSALEQGILTQDTIDHYTKRPGSISEREFGRFVTVDEVSDALAIDRVKAGE